MSLLARALPDRAGFRRVCCAALIAVIVGSLAWSVHLAVAGGAAGYFSTFTRIWQLASGGLLAVVAAPPSRWDRAGLVAGLVAILAAALILSDATAYPGYAALLPTCGAVLALQCGRAQDASLATRWLALRPVQFVGDISYSLYLWHWPIIVIHEVRTGEEPGPLAALLLFAGSIGIAALSKRFIEDRFRGPRRRPARVVLAAAVAGTAVCLALAFALHRQAGGGGDLAALDPAVYPGAAALRGAPVPPAEFRPRLIDAVDDLPQAYSEGCIAEVAETGVTTCLYGPPRARLRVALIGDSIAVQWLPALEVLVERMDLHVVAIAKTACAFSLVPPYYPRLKRAFTECADWTQNVIDYLAREPFDLVVVTMSSSHVMAADRSPKQSREQLADGIRRALDAVAGAGQTLVVLRPTPRQRRSPRLCVAKEPPPHTRCSVRRTLALWSDALTAAAQAGGYRLLDLSDLFCPGDRCPPVIGNVFVYRDRWHITASYMRTLAPMLAEGLGLAALH